MAFQLGDLVEIVSYRDVPRNTRGAVIKVSDIIYEHPILSKQHGRRNILRSQYLVTVQSQNEKGQQEYRNFYDRFIKTV